MQERLQKIIARAGIASRRHAEALIAAGRVKVNGKIVREQGVKADTSKDKISVDGQPIHSSELVVYALNKPIDVVSTSSDPRGRQTVIEFVPKDPRVYPVGRLDRMTSGLLLLTNDGDLALALTHPRYGHTKEYEVVGVSDLPISRLIERMRHGVQLTDGPCRPDEVAYLGRRKERPVIRIVVHEGRNHLLRRLCSRVGFEIIELTRTRIGEITLKGLQPGSWRRLTPAEVKLLRSPVGGQPPGLPKHPASGSSDR